MKLAAKRGFTIVELLVVITIIGILMAMLFPAINAARVNARRIQCVSRQTQLGKGMLTYVTKGDRFPGYVNPRDYWENDNGVGVRTNDQTEVWNWVVSILPHIDRADAHKFITLPPTGSPPTGAPPNAQTVTRIESLTCPADVATNKTVASLSYVVNGGMADENFAGGDLKANGVFFRHIGRNESEWVNMSLAYITRHDGAATTLMLTENVNALLWDSVVNPAPTASDLWEPGKTNEYKYAVVWGSDLLALNGPSTSFADDPSQSGTPMKYARPSSRHPDGFVVTYCDGHTQFMNDSIGYDVYSRIMTPDGFALASPQALLEEWELDK